VIYSQVALILIGSFWAPWWWISVVGLLFGWRFKGEYKLNSIMISSFFSSFLVWSVFSYYFDVQSSGKIGEWLALSFGLPFRVFSYIITGFLAGFVTAFSSYVGTLLKK
jgi:hypothetical protein